MAKLKKVKDKLIVWNKEKVGNVENRVEACKLLRQKRELDQGL